MLFISTRGKSPGISLSRALLRGLAPDGGLYVPESFPPFEPADFDGLEAIPDIAVRLLTPFCVGDALAPHLETLCREAFDFPIPLRSLDGREGGASATGSPTSVLELFHGPTAAFKDVGARFLAAAMTRLGDEDAEEEEAGDGAGGSRTILVATSGDTGGAIAAAFAGKVGIEVGVLFPEGRVSARQQQQLTCWGGNIRSFAVRGVFDDCQRMVKAAFADEEWRRRRRLTSANSINIARLLPQTVYYAAASLWHLRRWQQEATFLVPSGNVGNACAALWAREMGLPVKRVVLVANANRPVPDYFATGHLEPRPSVATLANAMDVGNPSNMERVLDLHPDLTDLQRVARADSVDDATIRRAIVEVDRRHGLAVCPHTATAFDYRFRHPDGPAVIVATAHPAKFETIVEPLLSREIPLPPALADLLDRPTAYEELEAELTALENAMDRPAATGTKS